MLPDCCRFANDAVRCPRKHVDVCPTMHLPTYASFVPLASRARRSSARGQRPSGDSRFVLCPSCGLRLRVHKCVRAFRVPPRRSSNSLTRNVVPAFRSFSFMWPLGDVVGAEMKGATGESSIVEDSARLDLCEHPATMIKTADLACEFTMSSMVRSGVHA